MRKAINTNNAPQAIGPYSQAIKVNGFIFVSGQLPIEVDNAKIPETISRQTEICLDNISAILEEAGSSLDKVVKCTVFMQDLEMFKDMNEIYEKYFTKPFPARSTLEVARLPKDVFIEIEVIATD